MDCTTTTRKGVVYRKMTLKKVPGIVESGSGARSLSPPRPRPAPPGVSGTVRAHKTTRFHGPPVHPSVKGNMFILTENVAYVFRTDFVESVHRGVRHYLGPCGVHSL